MAEDDAAPGLDALLEHLRDVRGFDFTGYKRASLERRVGRRLADLGIETYAEYVEHLEVHAEEFTKLFNTILINVTSLFRDLPSWEYLAEEVVPDLLRAKGPTSPIRVWSAGCASGEEPHTLAMVLAAALGPDDFRDRVKIYATDVDEEALSTARTATFTERDVEAVPEAYRRFLTRSGDLYMLDKELRRSIVYGRHDLIQDAPISRVDLLTCRNVLIYLNAETQAGVLKRFNFALNDEGYLFLGKAEMLLTHTGMFQPVDLRRRVFRKAPGTRGRAAARARGYEVPLGATDLLRRIAFDTSVVPQVILDADDRLAIVNERATNLFDLTSRDVGRPFGELEMSYRPLDLRPTIEEARATRRPVWVRDVEWLRAAGERVYLDVQVVPLLSAGGDEEGVAGIALTFADVTRFQELKLELEHANVELETAYEELQSTNEELETTNEELQSTVEELETTNEELQSTNEELETMNEELSSTNDELQAINDQLRDRTFEVARANGFLQAIVSSLHGAVAVLDSDLNVLLWGDKATELFGLRPDEVARQPFLTLDIGLPVAEVAAPLRRVVSDGTTVEVVETEGHDRRGRPLRLRIRVSKLAGSGDLAGAIVYAEPVA